MRANENVLRLQVAVHYSLLVHVVNAEREALCDLPRVFDIEALDYGPELAAFQKF